MKMDIDINSNDREDTILMLALLAEYLDRREDFPLETTLELDALVAHVRFKGD